MSLSYALRGSAWRIRNLDLKHLEWVGGTNNEQAAVAYSLVLFKGMRKTTAAMLKVFLCSVELVRTLRYHDIWGTHVREIFCLRSEY